MFNKSLREKSLREYSDEELMQFLQQNLTIELSLLGGITSEILRRMNERMPLLTSKSQEK